MHGRSTQYGVSGRIGEYELVTVGDLLQVMRDGKVLTVQVVERLGVFVAQARDLRLGWGQFPDFEVLYLYDKADDNYGYAVNLAIDSYSEWGYAPFEP